MMKRLPLLILGLIVLTFGSCDLFNALALHGTWEREVDGFTTTWTFNPDDTMEWVESESGVSNKAEGTYQVDGDELEIEIEFQGQTSEFLFGFEIRGDELKVWEGIHAVKFKRK